MSGSSYPIILTGLGNARCVVVGGGAVAERKVDALLEAGARVAVISPELTDRLQSWADDGRIEHTARRFESGDLRGAALVIAATSDRNANAEVAREAHGAGLLVNVADDPDAGNFITTATVRQGDLLLAVSTGSTSPSLARFVRHKLETTFGPEYGELLKLLGALRRGPARQLGAPERLRVWQGLASEQVLRWLREGERDRVQAYAQELLAQARR